MNEEIITLGEFIVAKRAALDMPQSQLAKALGISAVYMCDIEKNRRATVSKKFLDTLATALHLSELESELLYDLAAIAKKTISPDLPEYIMERKVVRTALRTAKKKDIPDETWDDFITNISDSSKRD